MSETVQATRAELEQVLDHLNAIRKILTGILERVELPANLAEGSDPTYTGRVIPPVEGLHDSGDGPYDPRD